MSKLLTLFLVAAVFVFTNCASKETTTTNSGNTTVAAGNSNQKDAVPPAKTTEPTNTTVAAGDKIGVAECDEYITKVEACIFKKVPEANRGMYQSSFEQMRKSWKDAASNPQGKAALATGCKQALETAKQAYAAYSCEF